MEVQNKFGGFVLKDIHIHEVFMIESEIEIVHIALIEKF